MEELRPRSGRKLHWHDEGAKRRREIAEKISELPLTHLVVIRTHLSGEAPERQRRHCMERLLYELGQTAVSTVTFESRGQRTTSATETCLMPSEPGE